MSANLFTIDELDDLTQRINQKLNIPLVREGVEAFFIRLLIREIERFVYLKFGKNLSDILDPASPGEVTDDEQKAIEELAKSINKKVNIPLVGERKEEKIITAVIRFVAKVD